MNLDAMTARLAVLTRALPRRILLVDDDDCEQDLLANRLDTAGFEIARAANGDEALALMERQWFPLVITDWQMPVMDGLEFTRQLRSRGFSDTYVIMLSMRDSQVDYERGYVSGVDDYLPKTAPDAELFSRIHAAFNTLALRRSLRDAQQALEDPGAVDPQSGAFAGRELQSRLNAEIRRAQRYGRHLTVVAVSVADPSGAAPEEDVLRGLVQIMAAGLRAHIDWIGRCSSQRGAVFALVAPETGLADAQAMEARVLAALRQHCESLGLQIEINSGIAALDRTIADGMTVEPANMLDVAAQCLNCPGRAGDQQLRTVKRSVAGRLAIVCRQGYVVDSVCTLKSAATRN